jgi:membrane protease YdiL (CAAX protease family)
MFFYLCCIQIVFSPGTVLLLSYTAKQGDSDADFKLGYIFFEGKYVAKDFDKALEYFQKVVDSEISDDLKGSACLMIGGIQLKQGKTVEGFATLKKAVKYPSIKKILVVLTVIGVLGGVIFLTAMLLTLYFILKNNKSFSTKKSWSIVEAVAIMGAFIALQIGMSLMIVVPFFDKICKDIFLKLIFWTLIGNSIVIFIAVILAKIRPISIWKQFGFVKINFKKWLMLIVGGWISIIAIGVVYEQVLKIFGIKLDGQMINQELQKYDNAGSIIFLILIIGFIMPVIEELIFRGVLFQALRAKMSAFWSVLISSVIFAAVHGDPVYFIPLLATGIVCSYAFEKTKSIYTPIGVHILNNLFAVVVTILFSN